MRTFKVKSAINDVRTLKVADLAEARIALVTLIMAVLKNGLTILGVSAGKNVRIRKIKKPSITLGLNFFDIG